MRGYVRLYVGASATVRLQVNVCAYVHVRVYVLAYVYLSVYVRECAHVYALCIRMRACASRA